MKKVNSLLFTLVCAAFSAALLIMALFASMELAEVNDAATETQSEIERLKEENGVLRAELETELSLQEIDEYAREKLGMRTPNAEQIIYTDLG